MVKFNINMLMAGIQQYLENLFKSTQGSCEFELTLKPEKGDMFTHIPATQRAGYLRYVSMVYRITLADNARRVVQTYYLFLRNGRADDNSYTRLSSIELGYIENKSFHSFFKQHFIGDISKNEIGLVSSLTFPSFEDMKSEAKSARDIVCSTIINEFTSRFINFKLTK